MKRETAIQNLIKIALSKKGCIVHRANVGTFFTLDGRKVHIGIEGHSDLYGHRPDGKIFYIEVKTPDGRLAPKQANFLSEMKKSGAIAGVAHNEQEAIALVFKESDHE